MAELYGDQEAREALDNVDVVQKETVSDVKQKIADIKRQIAILTPEELEARRKAHDTRAVSIHFVTGSAQFRKVCPGCESFGMISATPVGSTAARIKEGDLVSQRFFSPKKFECKICGLEVVGSQALRIAGLSDQIVDEETNDPVEFFGIDPMDYIDADELRKSLYEEEYDNE